LATTASVIHAVAAAFGLAALFTYWPLAFAVIKYCGTGYLTYLGITGFRAGGIVGLAGQALGLLFQVTGVPTNLMVALAGGSIAALLARHPFWARLQRWLSSVILVAWASVSRSANADDNGK
jgi:threonine/homoserine/homoserine lactone efflux protein